MITDSPAPAEIRNVAESLRGRAGVAERRVLDAVADAQPPPRELEGRLATREAPTDDRYIRGEWHPRPIPRRAGPLL